MQWLHTVAFSHFYKIPLVPKVTKFIFYNISSSLLTLSSQKMFGKTKVCLLWEKNISLMGNQKWQKQNWIWKIENLLKWPNIRIWDFQLFKFNFFLSFLVSHQKTFCFSKKIYFCLIKNILKMIASIEKKIYYKR